MVDAVERDLGGTLRHCLFVCSVFCLVIRRFVGFACDCKMVATEINCTCFSHFLISVYLLICIFFLNFLFVFYFSYGSSFFFGVD